MKKVLLVRVLKEKNFVFEKLNFQIINNNLENNEDGIYEYILPHNEKLQKLEAIQSEKIIVIRSQKYEKAAEIVVRENKLLSEILEVENHKDYLIYKGWINESYVCIFRK